MHVEMMNNTCSYDFGKHVSGSLGSVWSGNELNV